MICKLCGLEKNPKTNTHYLSDFIIKSALNENGVIKRGKGFYWGIDTSKLSVVFKFQQQASPIILENLLGRQTTEEENKDAEENIEFTVSDKFCKECEDIFTAIETTFSENILPKFRNANLQNTSEIILNAKESRITRLFFLLQFWRTSICDSAFNISENLTETLRKKILNSDDRGLEEIPLSITYLETLKDEDDTDTGTKYKTQNVVAPLERTDPFVIILNDFVIQLYEDLLFPFYRFYGYNEIATYIDYLNLDRSDIKVKVLSNRRRKEISSVYFTIAAKSFMRNQAWFFLNKFSQIYNRLPTNSQIQEYLISISSDKDIMKFTPEKLKANILRHFKTMKL